MDVVGHHGQADNPPVIHAGTFIEELLDLSSYIAYHDSFAILRHPH